MDQKQHGPFRARSRLVLAFAGLLAVQSAGACGEARTEDTGSETHWLLRCNSDLECGEGSCECGVCSKPCDTSADCGALGLGSVECVSSTNCEVGAIGSSPAEGAVCLLPCDVDADCSELPGAICRSQRCEVPESALGDGEAIPPSGTLTNGSVETLCDGSEDVRVAFASSRNFLDVSGVYYYFAQSHGDAFFAIDGQCRFWQGRLAGGQVYSGTLSAEAAQALAVEVGLGHVSEHGTYADDEGCDDGASSVLWTPAGSIRCNCLCAENPDASAAWRRAFRAAERARSELFVSGQPMTGPAQLGLTGFGAVLAAFPQPWPLERAPRANETVEVYSSTGSVSLNESSGVLMTDASELSLLRVARNLYQGSVAGSEHTPMVWTNPETGEVQGFDMLLRDEVPAAVQDALDAVLGR